MKKTRFVLQPGSEALSREKLACVTSRHYEFSYISYDKLHQLDQPGYEKFYFFVPLGTVEYVEEFAEVLGIRLPTESMSYDYPATKYIDRDLHRTTFSEAPDTFFVKPVGVKTFTGDIKSRITDPPPPHTAVWASPPAPFESEFRFYIQDFVDKPRVLGWARYDGLECVNPDPDTSWIEQIATDIHDSVGPSAYTIDIGWRSDTQQYDVIELNDAWALGLYTNTDPQSSPPRPDDYVEMLVSRWRQIAFCSM